MVKRYKLSNGIQVATYHLPKLKSVHLRISVKCGALVEDPRVNGVAHFMEHMLVQGIPSYPTVEEFSSYIESLAGSYGAFTESLIVNFYITVPITHLEDAVKIASEVFFEPLFVSEALEKERRAVLDEINQKRDSHWYAIGKFLREIRFVAGNPLTFDIGGEPEIIEKITREDLVSYWKQHFLPKNTYLLVTGNFTDSKLKGLLQKYFVPFKNDRNFIGFPKMGSNDFSDRQVAIRKDEKLSTCYIDFSVPAIDLSADWVSRVKQNILMVILGQLRNSRLFKLLRYQKGLVYDVTSGSSTYPELGYIYISSQTAPQFLDETVRLIVSELAGYVKHGPTEQELQFVKNYLINQWMMTFDHPSSIASWVEGHLLWDDTVKLPEEYAKMLDDIKVTDLLALMKKYWDFNKLNLVLQGPIDDSRENVKKYEDILKTL